MLKDKKSTIIAFFLFVVFIILIFTNSKFIECPINKLTGLYCPGCGITRCIKSIMHLNFYQAFRYNPLVFCMLPFIIAYFIYIIYLKLTNKKDFITKKIPNKVWYILLFVIVLYGILRNIPAFSFLAPTKIN